MAHFTNPKYLSIARPYSAAAFEYARERNELASWKQFLEYLSVITQQPEVFNLLKNPEVSAEKIFELFSEVLSAFLNSAQKNFLLLLAQNKRFKIMPEINELFNNYCAALEKMSTVRLVTAIEVGEEYKHKLSQALAKRIQHNVCLNCEINPAILGGAIIHMGDKVIDGSVRGKLNRLLENLSS